MLRQPDPEPTIPAVNVKVFTPFPVAVLPKALADLVTEGAEAQGCDPSQIALPMLAACSAAVGNSRQILLKKGSWSEPAVLWTVTVSPSGTGKSPAMKLAIDPIYDAQKKAIAEYEKEMEEHQARHDAWEDQNKSMRGAEPQPPTCARIVVSQPTVEALAPVLQKTPRGLLCARDELSGWLNGFNQYKAKGGADVACWLEMHRAGSLLIDRKTGDQKIIHAARAFVALTGTIQPATLRRSLTPEYREAGLAARLLMTMPPKKKRQWTEAEIRPSVKERYAATLTALMAIPMGGTADEPEPIDLPMTADAKKLWVRFYNEHNAAEQASEGGDLAAAWSKLEGYAARLALVLHCVRSVNGEVDASAVEAYVFSVHGYSRP
ncbi:MAG: YfjI family protein [Phycisphaerales bacterium]|nr:YfjI family protein [Phycisphaerales bacterium]